MGKNKITRFEDNLTYTHVVQPTYTELAKNGLPLKGKWNKEMFKRDAPLVLELGCGGGEYTIGLAQLQPEKNYVGVDIKGARLWRGAKFAKENGLNNVAFLRTHVDHLIRCFGKHEVDEIWLTFSDPQIGKARKRLTSPFFLARYKVVLKPGGVIHMKTDSPILYEYTHEQIAEYALPIYEQSGNVYTDLVNRVSEEEQAVLNIRTYYENRWLLEGRTIHYVRFGIEGYK